MEKTNKAKKPSWFKELKAEFNRIIWPTKERIAKETAVVVICAIIIGVIVAVLDVGISMEFRHWLDRSKEILWQRQIGMLFTPTQVMRIK